MDVRSRLDDLIRTHGLERARSEILRAARPSIELRLSPIEGQQRPGRSRFGGTPDLPSPDLWPSRGRRALSFIAQIRLDELHHFEAAAVLPRRGLLSFFYDAEGMPWGDFEERGGWKVLYCEDADAVGTVAAAGGAVMPTVLPPLGVSFVPSITVPAPRSIELERLGLADEEFEQYWDLRDETLRSSGGSNEPVHRMLGHPDAIQGCMQRTVQFKSRDERLPEGVYSYYEHPRAAELIPGSFDWRLLLQVDSDERLGVMWGDAGRIFFWVHKDDLAALDLSRAWLFLQCY